VDGKLGQTVPLGFGTNAQQRKSNVYISLVLERQETCLRILCIEHLHQCIDSINPGSFGNNKIRHCLRVTGLVKTYYPVIAIPESQDLKYW
jgi:hypothetical protein